MVCLRPQESQGQLEQTIIKNDEKEYYLDSSKLCINPAKYIERSIQSSRAGSVYYQAVAVSASKNLNSHHKHMVGRWLK